MSRDNCRTFDDFYAEVVHEQPTKMAEAKRWVAREFYEPDSERYKQIMIEADALAPSCRCPAGPGDDCPLTEAECRARTLLKIPE